MPRNKKKKSTQSEQRRQAEIRKRIDKANANAEKRAKAAPTPEPKPDQVPVPQPAPNPEPAPEQKPVKAEQKPGKARARRTARPRATAPRQAFYQPARKILSVGDDGSVSFPARMGLSDLMKAIRSDCPSGEGTLYITLDGSDADGQSCDLSYRYRAGLFNRLEALDGRNAKSAPVLADVLDARLIKLRADMDENGNASWYASVLAAIEQEA